MGGHRQEAPLKGAGLAVAAAGVLLSFVLERTVVENDLFWHLAIGRSILEHGFPYVDPFGIGTDGLAWSPPEWLAEVGLALLYRGTGFFGISVVHGLVVGALGILVFLRAQALGARDAHALGALALSSLPASLHLAMRPLVLGHLLSALVLLELTRERSGARTLVPFFPLLFLLWANLHPSWPLGLLWIALELGGRVLSGPLARRFPHRFTQTPVTRSLVLALLSPLVVWMRPDGLSGALYPFVHVVGLGDQMREIIEWFPLDWTRPIQVLAVIAGVTALALASRRKTSLADLLFAALSLYLLLRHQRFLPLALIGIAPLLAASLPEAPSLERLTTAIEGPRGAACAAALALLLMLLSWPTPTVLEETVTVGFPVEATDALVAMDAERRSEGLPPLRVFTTFEDGGYVAWRRHGGRVYLDSRFDLYARAGIFREYLALRAGGDPWPVFSRHRMDAAMVPTHARDEHFAQVVETLRAHGFVEVFADEQAVLLALP